MATTETLENQANESGDENYSNKFTNDRNNDPMANADQLCDSRREQRPNNCTEKSLEPMIEVSNGQSSLNPMNQSTDTTNATTTSTPNSPKQTSHGQDKQDQVTEKNSRDLEEFEALVDQALKSSFDRKFQLKFAELKAAHMERRPFIVMAVLGQELLVRGHSEHAAAILELALKLSSSSTPDSNSHELSGANQRKIQCSVLSTISLAYFSLQKYDKVIHYMNRELEISKEIEDVTEQCRVLNNLGFTYQKLRKFDQSLEAQRKQLSLAMKNHLYLQASRALNAIGHLHSAKDDFSNALTSHTRCLDILRQLDDSYAQFRELLDIGHVHLMLNDLKAADEKFEEANQFLKQKYALKSINHEEFSTGFIMVQFNLAHIALKRQMFPKATQHYQSVIDSIKDPNLTSVWSTIKQATHEMRACNGLGQVCRLLKKFDEACEWFEKQLRLAEFLKDQKGQSRALCNLGMIYQHCGDHPKARQHFEANLELVDNNPFLKAYAHSYLGAFYLMDQPDESRTNYKESLRLFEELGYSTHEQEVVNMNLALIKERSERRELAKLSPTALSA